MKKRKKKLIFTALFLIIIIFFVAHKPSTLHKGFPVPLTAIQSKVDHKNRYEIYKWKMASFEKGLPKSYKLILKMWGWKEVKKEALGARKVYIKNGDVIHIYSLTDKIIVDFEKES
ncbi:hypothetical protein CN692_04750 [Bacillus sp. AFS002410]|uniref:hypothetical protein n=1 Tax=Bacillus sp. AFS002410 TaxID=2033481 RepID=UPI000BEF5968|nr:hypothetical protein [Bacillus sp. AFS002410]PEJ59506.1 hypothetical protein CN692_04750 [Bacillus sp. AFS002410]